MTSAQAKVIIMKEKWSFGGSLFKVEPTEFGDTLDVWNAEREGSPLSPSGITFLIQVKKLSTVEATIVNTIFFFLIKQTPHLRLEFMTLKLGVMSVHDSVTN